MCATMPAASPGLSNLYRKSWLISSSCSLRGLAKVKKPLRLEAFNHAISGNLARVVMDISAGNLVDLATWMLIRRDSYLPVIRHGVKEETVLAICNSPIHTDTLFAEEHL